MSVEDIRGLQLEWFGKHKHPSDFAVALESEFDRIGFSEAYVEQCISTIAQRPRRTKVIKDNVWGMIELDEPAIRLLDCPILQRLRRIRQLGFSYLIYPSAEHSRFVHSLGMFGVISRFIQSAARDASLARVDDVDGCRAHTVSPSDGLDLRHAALLHDSGHLPFSHATEVALQSLPAHTKVGGLPLEDFFSSAEKVGVRTPKLAELLSVAIVLSPRFCRFYSKYVRPAEEEMATKMDGALRVASLIMGKPTDKSNIAYSDLISGRVIDADKLDYVSRDGMACGIPTGIDVGRLFLRSAFLRFSKDDLNRLRRRSGYRDVDCDQVHFIVNSSGRDTIEELISARTSLYHRVYFHQTTRNAERLHEQLIERVLTVSNENNGHMDALKIWAKSDEEMLAKVLESGDPMVRQLAIRVSSRQLPKRAVVFGQGELAPLLAFKQAFQRGQIHFEDGPLRHQQLHRYSKRRIFGSRLTSLEAAICAESVRLHTLIHDDLEDTEALPRLGETPHIAVSPAQFSPAVHDDCLVLQNHALVYSRELHNVTQTNDAEEIFQASGYVLSDEPWRELVFVAARKILAEQTKEWTKVEARIGTGPLAIPTPERREVEQSSQSGGNIEVVVAEAFSVLNLDHEKVIGRANLDVRKVSMIEARAGSKGYFDDLPFLMSKPDIGWEALRPRFDRFEGQYGWQISKHVAEAFVWQFPVKFRDDAIALLHAIEVLDAHTSVTLLLQALSSFLTTTRPRGKIRIAPLSPNSGHELRIALENGHRSNEEFSKHFSIHHSLEELFAADPRSESPIALIDDNVVSGSQAFAQLATWLGIPREQWPQQLSHESNIDDAPLLKESRERLLTAISAGRLGLCVSIGSTKKSEINRRELVTLIERHSSQSADSQSSLFGHLSEIRLPLFVGRDIVAASPPAVLCKKAFVDFLGDVGQNVLAWAKHGKEFRDLTADQKKQCKRSSLGYENVKGLAMTFRNVPVSTLTCLWAPGKYKQLPWMPLGLRRGYGKRVILT